MPFRLMTYRNVKTLQCSSMTYFIDYNFLYFNYKNCSLKYTKKYSLKYGLNLAAASTCLTLTKCYHEDGHQKINII